MTERPRFLDDLAGVAGGAMSVLNGLRDEAESLVRARVDETIRKLDLVRREDLEAVQEIAANARAAQERAEVRLAALEARVAALSQSSAVRQEPHTPTGSSGPAPGLDEPGVGSAGAGPDQ